MPRRPSPSPDLDPSPQPVQDETVILDEPGFLPGREPIHDLPDQSTTTSPASPSPSEDAGPDSGSDAASPKSGSTASTKPPRLDQATVSALTKVAATLVVAVGGILNERLASFEGSDEWIPDEHDQAAISTPLGRIGARHAPVGDGISTDVGDAIEAIVATAIYGMKNLVKRAAIRRQLRRQARAAQTVAPDLSAGDEHQAAEHEQPAPEADPTATEPVPPVRSALPFGSF